jgi:hypothetical protein
MRAALCAALAALLLAPAASADRWVRDAEGRCQREWTRASLARGPIAMLNGVLLPFRSLAGAFSAGGRAALFAPASLILGFAEGVSWLVGGTLETLSGGAFGIPPAGAAARLDVSPVVQLPASQRSLEVYRVDLCE